MGSQGPDGYNMFALLSETMSSDNQIQTEQTRSVYALRSPGSFMPNADKGGNLRPAFLVATT